MDTSRVPIHTDKRANAYIVDLVLFNVRLTILAALIPIPAARSRTTPAAKAKTHAARTLIPVAKKKTKTHQAEYNTGSDVAGKRREQRMLKNDLRTGIGSHDHADIKAL